MVYKENPFNLRPETPTPVRSGVAVRDSVAALLRPLSPSVYKTFRLVGQPAVQPGDLPVLSIFILREEAGSRGDYNTVIPVAFTNDATIGISVARGFDDPDYLRGAVEDDIQFIKNTLLTNAQFTRRWPGALFEGVPSFRTQWIYADQGEAFFAEMRLELMFRLPEVYVPTTEDRLEEIKVTTRIKDGALEIKSLYRLWRQEGGY
jgi:hypothetical protein